MCVLAGGRARVARADCTAAGAAAPRLQLRRRGVLDLNGVHGAVCGPTDALTLRVLCSIPYVQWQVVVNSRFWQATVAIGE